MTSPSVVSKVVVVGGGIFGVSTATRLARRGVETVLVNDGPVANGASGRSLSWLNSARRRSEPYHRLRMLGIDRYRTLAARLPGVDWLRFDGGLTWDPEGPGNEIDAVLAHELSLGYDALSLAPGEIASVTPGVDPRGVGASGAIFNPGEGWVDLPALIAHLMDDFGAAGGRLVTESGRAEVRIEGGRAAGVALADGTRIDADAVLVATGPGVPAMAERAGARIGEDTPIALLVWTKPVDSGLRAVLNTPRVAVRPTPDGGLALDSAWSEEEVVVNSDGSFEARPSTLAGLLEEASKVLAGNPKLELAGFGIGPKPIPGDGDPVFGPLDGVPGYYVAFSHSGATLGLIAGELLAGEIATGQPHPLLAPFRPSRFAR